MNKIIQIDENSRIKIEPLNWMLQQRRVSKGKEAWRTTGYYPDLISLVDDYINDSPANAEHAITTFKELADVIQNTINKLEDVIGKFIQSNGFQNSGENSQKECSKQS